MPTGAQPAGPADTHAHTCCLAVKDADDGAAGNMTRICIWLVFDTNEANQDGAHSNRDVIGLRGVAQESMASGCSLRANGSTAKDAGGVFVVGSIDRYRSHIQQDRSVITHTSTHTDSPADCTVTHTHALAHIHTFNLRHNAALY